MDIKVKCERLNPLCHGCLSVDRKLSQVSGELRELFHKIRNDNNQDNMREIQLCWECLAFLKKLRSYQEKIKMAQRLLLQCLQSYYITDGKSKPNSLSSLTRTHTNKYYADLNYEDKYITIECSQFNEESLQFNETCDQVNEICDRVNEKCDQDNETCDQVNKICDLVNNKKECEDIKTFIDETLEIKQECNDVIDETNDNYSEYGCDNEIKAKYEETKINVKRKYSYSSKVYNLRRKYASYAVVTKRNLSDVKDYTQNVYLNFKKYESYMYKDRVKNGYEKMPYECNECHTGFNYKLDLLRHMSFNHNRQPSFPYKCLACTTMITSEEHLDQHWTTSHTVMLKCILCTALKMFRSFGEVKKHVKKMHNKIYTCTKCRCEEFRSLTDFVNHYKSRHEERQTYICDYCRMSFVRRRTIIAHIKRLHIPTYCNICNRTYSNRKSFKNHNQVTHPELISGETSKELAYCVECDKQYPSVFKYKRHLQLSPRHTPQKKLSVPCPDCGKIFTRTNFMRNHFRFAHLKVTKHHCEKCNKYYTNGYGLRKHIERVHEKIAQPKNKICDICGRGFSTNKILINHRRTHTGERPHKCKYCPAAFAQETAMKSHQRTQHKNIHLELNS